MPNTYLSKTFSGGSDSNKNFTISLWFKCASHDRADDENIYLSYYDGSNRFGISIDGNDKLVIANMAGASYTMLFRTNRVFRDTNAWYHLVCRAETNASAQADRFKIYINGVQETSFSTATYIPQNNPINMPNSEYPTTIGAWNGGSQSWNGSMSHFHICDGYSYDASYFGETDATTGEWKIKTSPSVSYGTNGFWILKDGNSVTDSSPNSNNYTVSGGTLTKTEDCPSNVFATWNPLHSSTQSISNVAFKHGNTTFDNNESNSGVYPQNYSTLAASSGKYYFESKLIAGNNNASYIGISGAVTTEAYIAENAYTYAYREDGSVRNNNVTGNTYTSYGVNDIIQIAVDLDNNKLYFGINGTWVNSGDPTSGSTGTGAVYTITAPSSTPHGVYHFTIGDTSSSGTFEHATNFGNGYFGTTAVSSAGTNASGNGIFEYDVPTGYTALSTKGLNE